MNGLIFACVLQSGLCHPDIVVTRGLKMDSTSEGASTSGKARSTRDERRLATFGVALLMLAFALIVGGLSLLRYAAVRSDMDLAIYSQVVWNTAHGDPFRTSVLPFAENYLGNHFTPILALFAPIYLIWADPRVLLLAQVLAGALAILPLFLFAREQLPTPWAAVLLSAALVLYPAFQHQNLTDFHGIALGTTAVMWAYFALLTRRDVLLVCMLPVMVLIREDLSLVIIVMGLYAFLFQRRRWLGLILFVLGVAASALVLFVLIPAFRGGTSFHYGNYYDYLGDSPLAMLRTLLLEPGVWLPRALHQPKLKLLGQLLLPVAFLPLLAPSVFLLGGSFLAYLLLVDYPFHEIYILHAQYQALFVPVVAFGTVLGLARLVRWLGARWEARHVALAASALVLFLSLFTTILWGPLSDESKRAEFRVDEQSQAERALLAQIPADAGVVSDDRFAAALSTREGFFVFGGLFEYAHPIDYMIYEDTPVGFRIHPPALLGARGAEAWQVPRWQLQGRTGLTELRRRTGTLDATPLPEPPVFGNLISLDGVTGYGQTLSAEPGGQLEVALVWQSQAAELPRLVPFLQLMERQDGVVYRWASVDHEPYSGLFPTDRWLASSVVGDVYVLGLPPWLAPGEYELHTGLYTREGQQRLALPDGRTTAIAGVVQVAAPTPFARDQRPEVPIRLDERMAEGLVLYGQNPIPEQATSGGAVDVTLYWQATAPMERPYGMRLDLVAENAAAVSYQQPHVVDGYATTAWRPGTVVAAWYPLHLPTDLPSGWYDLFVTAVDGERQVGQPVRILTLQVESGG
jgi:uncharacterized membrane protein